MNASPRQSAEDAVALPAVWRSRLHPRRGGVAGPVTEVDATAVERLRTRVQEAEVWRHRMLRDVGSDPLLVARVQAHLDGAADPLGAAGLAVIVFRAGGRWGTDDYEMFADAWVTEHGLGFAARTLVELNGIDLQSGDLRHTGSPHAIRFAPSGDFRASWWAVRRLARRVRGLLAAADEPTRLAVAALLAELRDTPARRIVVSYLMPERQDWLDECCAHEPTTQGDRSMAWMLWCSAGTQEQLAGVASWSELGWYEIQLDIAATAVDGAGAALTPFVKAALDDGPDGAEQRKMLLNMLAMLPADEPFRVLLDRADQKYVRPALAAAMKRFPMRTLRLLPPAAASGGKKAAVAKDLLAGHVVANADLVTEALPGLTEAARATIEEPQGSLARSVEAAPGDLPELLVSPPWSRKRAAAEQIVLTGLTPPGLELAWADGEHDEWTVSSGQYRQSTDGVDWTAKVAELRTSGNSWYMGRWVLLKAPAELVRPLLADWMPDHLWSPEEWMPPIVARSGPDALPLALRAARARPAAAVLLMPYRDVEVARLMADALARLKSARPIATEWLVRHGDAAVRLLVPDALGQAGQGRRNAEGALLLLASRLGSGAVVAAARGYGDEVASAIETLLARDPLDRLPARIPKPGPWADPALLPQVLLRDRERALPVGATVHLTTMLAMSRPGDEYPGLDAVRELCDPASLAAFGRALFQRWQASGAPSKDGWVLDQLGVVGDDETVRRLTPLIRTWPGEGAHKRAVTGLDVLAAIGTDVALMHLHGVSQRVKFKALKTCAQEKIAEVADERGLTPEQLADRLVPDFGLDTDGSLALDYGPRRFTVGFDEELKPYVLDGDGRRRKALPKPGAKDDDAVAPDAYKRFTALKKDVRTIAAEQIRRLESAMVERRRWTAAEFQGLFVAHPLVWHLARRLVWLAEDGGEATTFRISEDRTLADSGDDALPLPESARIGIAHPLDLGGTLDAWTGVFADYEILQPFPQLRRTVHALTPQEREGGRLERFEGITVPVGKVLGLERRGWARGAPLDGGAQISISRPLPGGRHLVIELDPGIAVGYPEMNPDQRLSDVFLSVRPDERSRSADDRTTRFGELDPVTASEVLADLTELTEKAS